MSTSTHQIHIEKRGDRDVAIFNGIEYPIVAPRRFDVDPWGSIAENLAAGLKRSAARYGLTTQTERLAGEFVLQTRFSAIQSLWMRDHCKIGGHIRDNLSRTFEIAMPRDELDHLLGALRRRDDHREGLLGPRGSVFLYGEMRNVAAWPLRQNLFVPDGWIIVGNCDDLASLIEQGWKGVMAGARLALQISGWARTLDGR